MPWTGAAGSQLFQRTDGTRSGTQVWQQADAAGIDIVAPDHDLHDQDIGDGLSSTLKKDGGNSATADIPMGGFRFKNMGAAQSRSDSIRAADVQNNRMSYCTVGGTANAIILTNTIPISSYTAGQEFRFQALLPNSDIVTVSVDGLTPKALNVAGIPLSPGQIIAGAWITIGYDGTDFELASGQPPASIGVGAIMACPMPTVPAGWLECDGSAVSRLTYSALFVFLGTSYGTGDGSTTFNLPNYKDQFLRGFDAAGTDASSRTNRGDGTTGANVGTKQADAFKSHTHEGTTETDGSHTHTLTFNTGVATAGGVSGIGTSAGSNSRTTSEDGDHNHDFETDSTGGSETRPKNVTVKWIILALPSASVATAKVAPFFIRLGTDHVGTNGTDAQNVFADGASSLLSPGSSLYKFKAFFVITRAAGTTSHTTSVLFGGTAVISSILYMIESTTTTDAPLATTNAQKLYASAATATVAATTSTSATENIIIELEGTMSISTSGTITPQFQYSAAPGDAPTVKAGSFIEFTPMGSDVATSYGPIQ